MVFVALQFDYLMTSHIILRRRKPLVILGSLLKQRVCLTIPLVFVIVYTVQSLDELNSLSMRRLVEQLSNLSSDWAVDDDKVQGNSQRHTLVQQ